MMDRPRPRWLTILLFILPHVVGLILLLVAIVWGLTQSTSSEARAVAGALAIWLGENAVLLLYWGIRYSSTENRDRFLVIVHAWVVKWLRLIALARNAGPGLWIGWVSHSPVATAVITWLVMEILVQLNNLRLPAEEREPIGITSYLKDFAIDLILVGFGVLVGSLFRLWS